MPRVVGIKFEDSFRIYNYDSGSIRLKLNDWVMLEGNSGLKMGRVVKMPVVREGCSHFQNLKKVIRKANDYDISQNKEKIQKKQEIKKLCQEKIEASKLSIKLSYVHPLDDGSKVIIYFTSEERVDFRTLVKELAAVLHTRIEMRQIGVRNEAKILGGIGNCGRELCCASFLKDFEPVTVRMAKDQNLALDPLKISGVCGRLMCCLIYEYNTYLSLKKELPQIGKKVSTTYGIGNIIRLNILQQTIIIALENGKEVELKGEDIIEVIKSEKTQKKKIPKNKRS
ncbi:MAG: regulatory iron-sulfur-containing complex subunit RicT [Thermodesulfobacteriota bacterium]|nr:regulatory iron-sulfur-containing complex subunit RicT [Thermodesulfobacteriota bacterium]